MKRWLFLFLWIVGTVFPMAWLGRFSPGFRQAFDAAFGPLWMHILMHAGLFAVLALLLSVQLANAPAIVPVGRVLLVLATILGVGLLQEGFQAISQGTFSLRGAVFDLGIDLSGGLLGWGAAQGMVFLRSRNNKQG